MALEENEKGRILLEERYRDQIRSALEKEKKDKASGGFKGFLNSSFGLWLLSAIFISGAGTLYQQWQKGRDDDRAVLQKARDEQKALFDKKIAAESENRDSISKLDIEISYRLSTALLELSSVQSRIDAQFSTKSEDEKKLAHAQFTFGTLQSLNSKAQTSGAGLYPEYSTYTLPTLLADLRRRLPETERAPIESSIAAYASLRNSLSFSNDSPPSQQAGVALFQKVIRKRWQGTAFPHIDCSEKNPFC